MANFQKRAGAWRALIRRKGYPATSNTFDTKAEAEAWARKTESDIDRGQHVDHRAAKIISLADCLRRYEVEAGGADKILDWLSSEPEAPSVFDGATSARCGSRKIGTRASQNKPRNWVAMDDVEQGQGHSIHIPFFAFGPKQSS
jgi:hypothetical protein